jgi:glycine cleavage system transcriptional repressor
VAWPVISCSDVFPGTASVNHGEIMKKIVLFVFGPDRPGIIAAVSKTLFNQGCNLEDVSQTILRTEFMGMFLAAVDNTKDETAVLSALKQQIEPLGLLVHLKPMQDSEISQEYLGSFVITTIGPDKPGLIAGITEVLANFGVNITNLKAVSKGENYITIYEVDIPEKTNYNALRESLSKRAQALGLDLNLQHREIFEQIHRV